MYDHVVGAVVQLDFCQSAGTEYAVTTQHCTSVHVLVSSQGTQHYDGLVCVPQQCTSQSDWKLLAVS
jgi:hypothetical protein